MNNLTKAIKNRRTSTKNQNSKIEAKKNLDNINYPDDKDINDLFQICKSLIKGGFSNDNANVSQGLKNKQKTMEIICNAYNNIAYVKSNNLIIQEDIIENSTVNEGNLFTWKKVTKEEIKLEENKSLDKIEDEEMDIKNKLEQNQLRVNVYKKDSNNAHKTKNVMFEDPEITLKEQQKESIKETPAELHTALKRPLTTNQSKDHNLDNIILNIVKEEEAKIEKNYLYEMFMKVTNNGEELKILAI